MATRMDAGEIQRIDLKTTSFLSRLRRDQRGNALAIVAASVIPLVGAVGGGVDLTRAYMAEARLAQACDAAALAGRKVMRESDVGAGGEIVDGSATDREIDRFIDYNFPEGTFNSGPITRAAALNDEGELTIRLASTLPTQLLPIVGIDTLNIDAACSARRSGVNVDVVLVVDVTGSMNTTLGSTTRLGALKTATLSFLEVLDDLRTQLEPSGTRVRTAIVPYATTVNVGLDLIADEPNPGDYVERTAAKYYSREYRVYTCSSSNNYCNTGSSSNNGKFWQPTSGSYAQRHGNITLDLSGFIDRGVVDGDSHSNPYNWKGCIEMRQTIQTINATTDLSAIPAGAWDIIDQAPGAGGAPKWQPYIMLPNRDNSSMRYGAPTSGSATSDNTFKKVASAADINTRVPYRFNTTNVVTSPTLQYGQATSTSVTGVTPNNTCNSRVRILSEATKSDLTSYVNSLTASGGTYHDVGMYWGLALISPQAPFENPDKFLKPGYPGEEREVKRYIVFMTDGTLEPYAQYSAWGYEAYPSAAGNHTVTSATSTNLADAHRRRFRLLCEEAKRSGIEISTVVFSNSVASVDQNSLQNCATSYDHYYVTETASGLEDAFLKIARNIGYLRVSR